MPSSLQRTSKLNNPFSTSHRRMVYHPSTKDNLPVIPKKIPRDRSTMDKEKLRTPSSDTPKLVSKSEFEQMQGAKIAIEDSSKFVSTLSTRDSRQKKQKCKQWQQNFDTNPNPCSNPSGKSQDKICMNGRKRSQIIDQNNGNTKYKSEGCGRPSSLCSPLKNEKPDFQRSKNGIAARSSRKKQKLHPWELRGMLAKDIAKMKMSGGPTIREVENEINARLVSFESTLELSKELMQKNLWEVEPYSNDWFSISSSLVLALHNMEHSSTKQNKRKVSTSKGLSVADSEEPKFVNEKGKVISSLSERRAHSNKEYPGKDKFPSAAIPENDSRELKNRENFGAKVSTDTSPIKKNTLKRSFFTLFDGSADEIKNEKVIKKKKSSQKHQNQPQKTEFNGEENSMGKLCKPKENQSLLAKICGTETRCAIDLTVNSDPDTSEVDDQEWQSSTNITHPCPCCNKMFPNETIAFHVEQCLKASETKQNEALALKLHKKYKEQDEEKNNHLVQEHALTQSSRHLRKQSQPHKRSRGRRRIVQAKDDEEWTP